MVFGIVGVEGVFVNVFLKEDFVYLVFLKCLWDCLFIKEIFSSLFVFFWLIFLFVSRKRMRVILFYLIDSLKEYDRRLLRVNVDVGI